jgi:hypothetical protein
MNVTTSINALMEIMATAPMRKRLEAAETLLTYEAPPEVVEWTKDFLVKVIEDRERVNTDIRLKASALLRRAEAKRVAQQSVRSVASDHWHEVWRQVAAGRRRLRLVKEGLWPPPRNWCDDILADDYEPLRPSEGA